MSVAEESLRCSGLFEAEVLAELMLRFWNHPCANSKEFRNNLLERSVEVLRSSIAGECLLADIPPPDMNLVAALWYAEWSEVEASEAHVTPEFDARQQWLNTVRHALPSCFCDPQDLV